MGSALKWFWTFLRLAFDKRAPKGVRYMLLFAAFYAVSPIDLIPDWIPPIGWLDDAGILSLLVSVAWWSIPKAMKNQAALPRPTN